MKKKDSVGSPLDAGIQDSRLYRQFVASSSKASHDDLAVGFGRLNEAIDELHTGQHSGPVQDHAPEKDPLLLRPILALLTIAAAISGCIGVIAGLGGVIEWRVWAVFLLTGGPRLGYAHYKYRKEQKAWLARIERNS